MLRIANEYLKKNEMRTIKSKETVQAFGKPRNKCSLQAKQHRGKSLWSFTKSQKKECNRHINVHYNTTWPVMAISHTHFLASEKAIF